MSTESKIQYLKDKIQYAKDYFSYPWLSLPSRIALERKVDELEAQLKKLQKAPWQSYGGAAARFCKMSNNFLYYDRKKISEKWTPAIDFIKFYAILYVDERNI